MALLINSFSLPSIFRGNQDCGDGKKAAAEDVDANESDEEEVAEAPVRKKGELIAIIVKYCIDFVLQCLALIILRITQMALLINIFIKFTEVIKTPVSKRKPRLKMSKNQRKQRKLRAQER